MGIGSLGMRNLARWTLTRDQISWTEISKTILVGCAIKLERTVSVYSILGHMRDVVLAS